MNSATLQQANKRLILKLLLVVAGAALFAIALVPLYNVLCAVTGLNGKTSGEKADIEAAAVKVDNSRVIKIEFTGTVMPGLSWDLKPKQISMNVRPGQVELTSYFAHNTTNQVLVGQAVPSVSPGQAAKYFKKIECFCFKQQTLQPGEEKEMPVTFYVSPDLPKDIGTITLSYAFFPSNKVAAK